MTGKKQTAEIGSFNNMAKGEGLTAVKQFIGGIEEKEAAKKGKKASASRGSMASAPAPEPRNDEPKEKMSEEGFEQTMDDLDKDIDDLADAPEFTYKDKIKKHEISLEKAEEIIDSMIVDGYYEETYALTKKHPVTFRTRTLEDQNRIMERIETLKPNYPTTLSNLVAQYNVASSLVHFKGIDFTEMEFREKLRWVRECPDSVVRALATKLNKFDAMITDVMSEGAIENF
jgi:uncharacterized FlaG/YvyC family protein